MSQHESHTYKNIGDNSTKINTKDGIDYIFAMSKQQINNNSKPKDVGYKELIVDLSKTWKINLDIIQTNVENTKIKSSSKHAILNYIESIKGFHSKKLKLKSNIAEIKGKNFLNSLVTADISKKIYMIQQQSKEEINDLTDNLSSKIESAKSLDKRFMEYEKYIHKSAKKSYNPHFDYLKKYSLKKFVEENVDLNEKINDLKISVKELRTHIKNLNNEIANLDSKSKRHNRFENNETSSNIVQSMTKNKISIVNNSINNGNHKKVENSVVVSNFKTSETLKQKYGHYKTQSCDISSFNYNNIADSSCKNNNLNKNENDENKNVNNKINKKEKKIILYYLNQIKELEERISKLKTIRAKLSTGLTIMPKPRKQNNFALPNLNSSLLGISVINKKQDDSNFFEVQKTFLDANKTNNYDYSLMEK